jgi:hypothetical protein
MTMAPPSYDVNEVLTKQPMAVEHLDALLAKEMSKRTVDEVTNDPFWARFQSLRKGYAAEILGDVANLLANAGNESTGPELTIEQQSWIQDHPLSKWMNWFKPGGADMLGK